MMFDDFLDHLPVHWGLLLQAMVFASIGIVLVQIKTADTLDGMRRHAADTRWIFIARRAAMFIKLLALCWAVIYGATRGWQPWPPVVLFLLAFNVHACMQMLIMQRDIWQLRRLEQLNGA